MKRYIRGHFTVTFSSADGVAAAAVTALLAQLKPGAVIDDMTVDRQTPPFAKAAASSSPTASPPRRATDMARKRKPTMYVTFTLTDDKPILPETVKRMLDEMHFYSDIVEMRITEDDGPIPKRRVAIYYATSMPWESN